MQPKKPGMWPMDLISDFRIFEESHQPAIENGHNRWRRTAHQEKKLWFDVGKKFTTLIWDITTISFLLLYSWH